MNDMTGLFGGTYHNKRVLVTGHTGFKGSWLVLWLKSMGARVCAIGLAPTTSPSHSALLGLSVDEALIDIRNESAVRYAIQMFAPEVVFHMAAQALVRESYINPAETFDVNVMGLVNVLEAIRVTPSVRAVINVTTDKCYLQDTKHAAFTESDALGGHDPYSASKACAEIVTASYRASFLATPNNARPVAIATARAGNVIGGGDWATDRLIPDLARAAAEQRTVAIRSPNSVRPWQHVLEPLSGYLMLGQQLLEKGAHASPFSSAWNFGPKPEGHLTVAQVVGEFGNSWSDMQTAIDSASHPHEAATLELDCTKATKQLGWQPVWNASTTIKRTADWYRVYYECGALRTSEDLNTYVRDAQSQNASWTAMKLAA
ncbi:MAG: CDP-glucose 4,6-dehydratase [Gemmatimonadaceae bacterium]